jgi:Protein of unknown function (DUF3054)
VSRQRWPVGADLAAVLVFVLVGRHSHGEGEGVAGVLRTLWPFAAGLGVGWAGVTRLGWVGTSLRTGLFVGLVTAWLGLVLRAVSGQGVALSFAVVATVFLTLFLVGWRAVRWGVARILRR